MSITNKLNQIKNAIYGKEVRGAIHDAIKECYDDASVNHDNANMEVKLARGTHNTLNDRLDNADEIQAQTNAQLSQKANFKEINSNEVLVAPFFKSNSDISVDLFMSSDGVKFKKISDLPIYGGRDSSIIYLDGYFYILNTSYNPHDFIVRRSANLRNWQQFDVSCGIYDNQIHTKIWAGEWFCDDNGKVYIFISVKNGMATDITNNNIDNFETWMIDCDLQNMQFTNPRKVALEDRNKIDAFVIKKDGIYIMFIKDEVDKKLEKWTSTDLINWTKELDEVDCFNGDYVEGPSVTKFNGKYYLYVDKFMEPFTYVSESEDLINFTKAKPINIFERNRHATILNVSDKNAKMILNDFINSNNPQEREYTKAINLARLADETKTIEKLVPREGFVYQSFSDDGDIVINNVANENEVSRFFVILRSGFLGSITVKSGGGVEIPTDLVIKPSLANSDILIEFTYVDFIGKFKITTPINELLFSNQSIRDGYRRIDLNTISESGSTISNFEPDDGALYVASGHEVFTIDSIVANMPNGTRFFLGLFSSSSTGKIVLKSGTNLCVPNGEFVISKDNNRNELIYEVVKCADTSFRLRGN